MTDMTSSSEAGTVTDNYIPTKERAVFEEMGSWCIWTKFGRRPQFYHPTRELAMAEAERLACLRPGCKFIVMKMEGKFGVPVDELGEDTTEKLDEGVTA
jgi:hypothetical protein